jgi:hypothetical protein
MFNQNWRRLLEYERLKYQRLDSMNFTEICSTYWSFLLLEEEVDMYQSPIQQPNYIPWNKGKLSGQKAPTEAAGNMGDSDSIGDSEASP